MTRTKTPALKKQKARLISGAKKTGAIEPAHHEDDTLIAPSILKKPVDLDIVETAIGIDEKIDPEAPLIDDSSEESASDEMGIDEEDVNPVGDKWEQ
jgi:hypothetical protein